MVKYWEDHNLMDYLGSRPIPGWMVDKYGLPPWPIDSIDVGTTDGLYVAGHFSAFVMRGYRKDRDTEHWAFQMGYEDGLADRKVFLGSNP